MSKEVPLIIAPPDEDEVESGRSENRTQFFLMHSEAATRHANYFVTGESHPSDESRSPRIVLRQMAPSIVLCVMSLLSSIIALILGTTYSGYPGLCRRWSEYLEIAGYLGISCTVIYLFSVIQAVTVVTYGEKMTAHSTSLCLCQLCTLIPVALAYCFWLAFGIVTVIVADSMAFEKCKKRISYSTVFYVWLNAVILVLYSLFEGWRRGKARSRK
mmetsp:Transcript_35786/g.47238  ORF Transcript_35786/g.47238 Transcript_35786/m.47238 type:complete len:215 (+) Transcript_35786:30-674(+)